MAKRTPSGGGNGSRGSKGAKPGQRKARAASSSSQRYSASGNQPKPIDVGLPDPGYPTVNQKTEQRLGQPDALEGRVTERAGPIPTRVRTNAGSNLDPSKIDRILSSADLGIAIYQYAELGKYTRERDSHVMGIDRQRRQSVANKPFQVWPQNDSDPLAVGLAHFMRSVLDQMDALTSSLYSALSKNCDGWSTNELIWKRGKVRFKVPSSPSGGGPMVTMEGIFPRQIEWVHSKHTEFIFYGDRPLINLGSDGTVRLTPHKFLYTTAPGEGIAASRGYLRSVVWMHFFKHASIRDWQVFLHLYGIPFLSGRLDRKLWTDTNMKSVLETAIQAYGTGDEAPILTDGMSIEVNDPVSLSGSSDAWFRMAGFCNAEQSKAVLGETLTTEAGESGSYKLGNVHQDSAHEVIVGDALTTADDFRRDVFESVIELNKDELAKVFNVQPDELFLANPLCGFRTDREWSPKERLEIFLSAAKGGIKGSQSQIRRELQIDKPTSAEDEFNGESVIVPAGGKAAGAADAADGVNNPKPDDTGAEE